MVPMDQRGFINTLAQYLGLSEVELGESASLLDALAPIPDESKLKQEMREEYKDVLGSLQDQSKGYGAGVKEAMSSQQRQELVEAARRTGGGQRMLQGRSKGAALVQAKSKQAAAQANVVQNVAEQEKQLKESAKEQLQGLETGMAKAIQSRIDEAREKRVKAGLSIYQLAEVARLRE